MRQDTYEDIDGLDELGGGTKLALAGALRRRNRRRRMIGLTALVRKAREDDDTDSRRARDEGKHANVERGLEGKGEAGDCGPPCDDLKAGRGDPETGDSAK